MNTADNNGMIHPLSHLKEEVIRFFIQYGFEIAHGHERETEFNNFDSLNIPPDHPARDMHDTFWVDCGDDTVLRTHISSHQVPYLISRKDALESGETIRMISMGRVFRYEATDATHDIQFSYLEGVSVGNSVTLADLKGILELFVKTILHDDSVKMRLRPGYFPFTEPGIEIDLYYNGAWIEILGAGMIHPNVLSNAGIDHTKKMGFAFGVGLDRILSIRNGIGDIRHSYLADLRYHHALYPSTSL